MHVSDAPRRRVSLRAHLVLALLGVALASAVACGSGNDDDLRIGVSTPAALPTLPAIADATSVPLTTVTSTTGLYTVDLPPGWTNMGVGATSEEVYQYTEGGLLRAEFAVTCEPVVQRGERWAAADFVNRDGALLAPVQAGFKADDAVPTVVAGEPALAIDYTAAFAGGIQIRSQAVYFTKGDCGWIVRMRVFAPGDDSSYRTLFDRIVASFRVV
jgi:hypothetical protein